MALVALTVASAVFPALLSGLRTRLARYICLGTLASALLLVQSSLFGHAGPPPHIFEPFYE